MTARELPESLRRLLRRDWETIMDQALFDETDRMIIQNYIIDRLPQMDTAMIAGIDRKTVSRRLKHIYGRARECAERLEL